MRESIIKNKYQIEKVYNILEDNHSRRVLENIINYRLTFEYLLEDIVSNDEYIVKLSYNEKYLDAGAYYGDTI